MAVRDEYSNAYVEAGKKGAPIATGGCQILAFAGTDELAAADSDGSVLRIARLPANAIPFLGELHCDSIASMSDLDVGLYKPGVGGAAVDADIFADGLDLNAGVAITTTSNNAISSIPIADIGDNLWELLGLSAPNRQDYDLALTWNTIGSAAGTVSWRFLFAVPN